MCTKEICKTIINICSKSVIKIGYDKLKHYRSYSCVGKNWNFFDPEISYKKSD